MREDKVTAALSRITKPGSHGVCIKARDLPLIGAAVVQLTASNFRWSRW
jgi:LacI family transcriptional regulator